MDSRIIPITLALKDKEERKRIEKIVESNHMVRLMADDAAEMGVLIYEPGDSASEDLPHIIQALESGQAEDVFLAGSQADPEILIAAMRSGIREFLQYPVQENDFRAAIMRTAMRNSLDVDASAKGRIITLLGAKPGLGASTLAVNLAWALNAPAPGRTLLLDLRSPVGEIPYFLDIKYEYNWSHLVEDISRLDSTYLKSVVAEHECGLHVLPGPPYAQRPDDHTLFLILEQLRRNYDYVVVDTAYPSDEQLPKEVEHADSILVALHLTLPSLARTSRLMTSIRTQDPDGDRRMRLIANQVPKGTTIGVDEASDVLGKPISWAVPDDQDAALSSLNQGTPVVDVCPKSAMTRAILTIAEELDSREKKAKKGFSMPFASLFGKKKQASDDILAGAIS
ncbi:MAG: histidine kinase [Pseudodesulfovibrio sp.]|nr:histidine kinase [Pseudodesulfovibrio sp.]